MKEKGIISTNQFVWILFSIIACFATLQVPALLIYQAGRDAWLSIIGAYILDALLAIVYNYLGNRFLGQSNVQYSITILGKYFGRIVGIMFPLFYLLIGSVLMRSLGGLISNFFLPKTPIVVIISIAYLVMAYGLKKGIEAIARTCEVLGPLYLLSLVIMFVLLTPEVKLHRLKPVLANGAGPFIAGIPFILSFISICIAMGMYIPICNKPKNGFLAKFIALTLGCIMIGLIVEFSIGIFGAERAGNMVNAGIQLAKLVRIGSFFERLEIIFFITAVAAGIMTTINLIWAFCVGISQVVGLNSYKPVVYSSVLLAFVLSMTSFENTIELLNYAFYTNMIISIFVGTVLELLLFITALISGKRGDNQQNSNSDNNDNNYI